MADSTQSFYPMNSTGNACVRAEVAYLRDWLENYKYLTKQRMLSLGESTDEYVYGYVGATYGGGPRELESGKRLCTVWEVFDPTYGEGLGVLDSLRSRILHATHDHETAQALLKTIHGLYFIDPSSHNVDCWLLSFGDFLDEVVHYLLEPVAVSSVELCFLTDLHQSRRTTVPEYLSRGSGSRAPAVRDEKLVKKLVKRLVQRGILERSAGPRQGFALTRMGLRARLPPAP